MKISRASSLITALLLLTFFAGCATNSPRISIQPEAQEGQALVDGDRAAGLESRGDVVAVTATVSDSVSEEFRFLVLELAISNESEGPIEVLPSRISARDEEQQSWWILSVEEHVAALTELHKSGVPLDAKLGTMPGGSFYHSNTYSGATHQSAIGETTYAPVDGRNQSLERRVSVASEGYLKAGSLPAEESVTGAIWIVLPEDMTQATSLLLTVPVGGESHRFRFTLTPPAG